MNYLQLASQAVNIFRKWKPKTTLQDGVCLFVFFFQNAAKEKELAELAEKRQQLEERCNDLKEEIKKDEIIVASYRRRCEDVKPLWELIKDRRQVLVIIMIVPFINEIELCV